MNLGYVALIFGVLAALGIALPALWLGWWLLLPTRVATAQHQVNQHPWRMAASGLGVLLLSSLLIVVLMNAPSGILQMIGWIMIFLLLTLSSFGTAALARLVGNRLEHPNLSDTARLLRGALILELAMVVPLVGWFVILPLVTLMSLGCGTTTLLRRTPRSETVVIGEAIHGSHTP